VANHIYFAYGSNMNAAEMKAHCRKHKLMGVARLDNWRLAFTHYSEARSGGVADIVELGSPYDTEAIDTPGLVRVGGKPLLSPVWGLLWQIDDRDRAALDKKEGYSAKNPPEQNVYKPVNVTVLLTGNLTRRIVCYAYVVAHKNVHVPPSPEYMRVMMDGAFAAGLPSIYTGQLAKVQLGRAI
jgi:hypothetical protein